MDNFKTMSILCFVIVGCLLHGTHEWDVSCMAPMRSKHTNCSTLRDRSKSGQRLCTALLSLWCWAEQLAV